MAIDYVAEEGGEQPEDPLFEALLHSTDLDRRNATQAGIGVSAAMAVTGP